MNTTQFKMCLMAYMQKVNRVQYLMSLITSPQNIALAYRRIKRNKGSRTPGTNMGTIEQIAERGNDSLVDYVQRRLANYKPHPVRRVMIPKDNGKERPLSS